MAVLDRLHIGRSERNQVAAVIDVREFEADAAEQEWRAALRAAREHVAELEGTGRND